MVNSILIKFSLKHINAKLNDLLTITLNILMTGGTGYLSTHTAIALQAEHSCHFVDNLTITSPIVLDRLTSITGRKFPFFKADIFDISTISNILKNTHIDLVIHFAALKKSQKNNFDIDPASHNSEMTKALIKAMSEANVYKLIFASSASVYGEVSDIRINEDHPKRPLNNYGLDKLQTELYLEDLGAKHREWSILSLRHFNVAGMHSSCLLGRNDKESDNNLVDNIINAALTSSPLTLDYGYETIDGTFLRDYVHVMDIAEAHIPAINLVNRQRGFNAINVGSGTWTSALGLVNAFEKISDKKISVQVSNQAPNAVKICIAELSKCKSILGWEPKRTLNDICQSEWNYKLSKVI